MLDAQHRLLVTGLVSALDDLGARTAHLTLLSYQLNFGIAIETAKYLGWHGNPNTWQSRQSLQDRQSPV